MTEPQTLSSLGNLVLARLLVPGKRGLTRGDLRKGLEPFFTHRQEATDLSAQLDEQLTALAAAGLVTAKPLALTETGRTRALAFLGTEALPPRTTWKTIRNTLLLPLALHRKEQTPDTRKWLARADGLRAALLSREHNLTVGATPTLSKALDALAWKQLGLDRLEPFTLQAVLAHALGLEGKINRKKIGELLPAKAVGARNSGVEELRLAAIRRWLDNPPPPPASEAISFNLAGFAEAVREAARAVPTGRFGDRKVFISHVWNALQERRAFPGMDEQEFKRHLGEANRAGLLALSRADLVEAMDPQDVRSSETPYLNATFHFVQV